MKINDLRVVRRVAGGMYYQTTEGSWWRFSEARKVFVQVPDTQRDLRVALKELELYNSHDRLY